jgi:hypothetical protein
VAIPPVPPIHPSHHRLDQGNNYFSAAASRNATQTIYPTPKSPNLFPQKCDHFRGSQAIHHNRFLQLARSLFVRFAVSFAGSCGSRKCIVLHAQITGFFAIALCALRKSSRSLFVISRNRCNRSTRLQPTHHGCLFELTAFSQSHLQYAESLAVSS